MGLFVEISEAAGHDLEDIFDYTFNNYGLDQAVRYVTSFDDFFLTLAMHPEMGKERLEIRPGLQSMVNDHHVVFYRILHDRIRIVRVLHGSRDLPRQFPGVRD